VIVLQGAVPPEIPLATPVASSSHSRRARRPATGGRRFDPIKFAEKKADLENEWNQTLVRFQVHFDTLYNVQNGRPSGGLAPEKALAEMNKFVKDDLKRSVSNDFYCAFVHHFTNLSTRQQPLRDTKAGEGKRSRDSDDYLKGILGAIRPAKHLVPAKARSEDSTMVATLSRRKRFFSSLRFDVTN
jgi:hypothetical protein